MLHLFLFICLSFMWFVFSGKTEPFFIISGLCSVSLSVFLAHKMGFIKKYKIYSRAPLYWLFMIKEIIISTMQVVKRIWALEININPKFVTYPVLLKSDKSYAVFANSITLTPGTVSLYVFDDRIIIHCLDIDYMQDLQETKMYQKVLQTYS